MRAYFSVIGIGMGHILRCLSIADKLREEGVESVFSTYGKPSKLLEETEYRNYVSDPLMWSESGDGNLDYERTLLKSPLIFLQMLKHFKEEKARIDMEDPDIIITDSRYSIIPASKETGIPRIYITNQPRLYMPDPNDGTNVTSTPLEKLGCWWNYNILSGQDMILIPDFPMPESISYRHMILDGAPDKFKEKLKFVGPIAPHRPEDVSEDDVTRACEKYGVEPDNFIYIAFSGPGKIKPGLSKALYDLFTSYEIPTIMGTGEPGKFKIHGKGNFKLVDGWIEEREALLKASKVVISRAGLCTLSEIVAFGKRAIVIPQSNQPEQESNAEGIEKLGFAKKIEPEEFDSKRLKEDISILLNSEKVKKAANRYKQKAQKWKGEEKSTDIIMNYLINKN